MKEHLLLLGESRHQPGQVMLHGLPQNTPLVIARLVVLHSLPLIVVLVVLNVLIIRFHVSGANASNVMIVLHDRKRKEEQGRSSSQVWHT